ncbi:PTS sugar transporter subunit IIC [Vagococcus intermedius]|uniref:Permease IIC component n=1 Tax=Vagococcus intermedius TaxID=2991418 RepID=A0AAF0I8J0_9ENTE|nr:PTS sugar transporter subunit IIC [Vagococcus intermedius]WEG74011.1 PTS sugar transporter subunit IIC [Vagococcus intermedius]WEG76091.1 PTS sugar transporter subunit IIC [Vagococcus intermedius]
MDKLLNLVEAKLAPLAQRLDRNRYLTAIKDGFFVVMPLLIIGSAFLLVTQLPFKPYLNFMESLLGKEWTSYFLVVNTMTMNMMTLFVVLGIARSLARQYKIDTIGSQAISLLSFFILTPVITDKAGAEGLPIGNFGAAGLFIGMMSTIATVELFRLVIKKGWIIKMPESVPPNVANSFSALIPGFIVVVIFNLIRILFLVTPYETAHNFVFEILQKPLLSLGSSLPALIVLLLFEASMWAFGIHGSNIMLAVMTPIWTALAVENAEAFARGDVLPNIVNMQFYSNFIKLGGASGTIGLAVACMFFAKSSQYKTLGKLSFGPALFNINEPLIFGMPIVLNPIMLIPFILCPIILGILSYIAMATKLVPITNGLQLPWTMPPIFSGFILSGWRGAVFQVIEMFVSFMIFFPFFKLEDRKALAIEENKGK